MNFLKLKWVWWLPLVGLLSGCVGVNPQPSVTEVNGMVKDRLGGETKWPADEAERTAAANIVRELLLTNLTSQSAVSVAFLNSPALRADFEELGISQAELAQASRLPNIQIAGSWRIPNRPPSGLDAEYSASANVLDMLLLPARKKIAAVNLEQAKARLADKVLRLAAEVQSEFYRQQAELALIERLKTIGEVNAAAAELAQRQFDAGDINELELHLRTVSRAESRLELIQAQAEVVASRERLNRLIGWNESEPQWTVTGDLPKPLTNEPPTSELETMAVKQRMDLAALQKQTDAVAVAMRLQGKTRFFPGARVGVDTEQTPDRQHVTGPTLELELPIFDQGQPAVARLNAQYRQLEATRAAMELKVRSEVRTAAAAVANSREAFNVVQTELLPLRQTILQETLLHYNAMQRTPYELLMARQQEQETERKLITAERDYWLARVELERAVGGKIAANPK